MKKVTILTEDNEKFNDLVNCSLLTTTTYTDNAIYIRKEFDYLQGWFGITDLEDEFVDYLYLPRYVFINSKAKSNEINDFFMSLSQHIIGFQTEDVSYTIKEN